MQNSMETLVSGLNSYLGSACMSFMPDNVNHVHGLVRDEQLFRKKITLPVTATISSMDLIRMGVNFETFTIPNLDLAIYFTQIPDLDDEIAIQYELLSLRNFIHLSQRNNCNRILYVGRLYDKRNATEIENLFHDFGVSFTILLKDIAIGKGTSFDRFMSKILQHKYVYLFRPKADIRFSPVLLKDVFEWIKMINWKTDFINQYVEFGGPEVMDFTTVFYKYAKKRFPDLKYKIISIKNKKIAQWCNRYLYGINYDIYTDYISQSSLPHHPDNSIWQNKIDFKFTAIDEGI